MQSCTSSALNSKTPKQFSRKLGPRGRQFRGGLGWVDPQGPGLLQLCYNWLGCGRVVMFPDPDRMDAESPNHGCLYNCLYNSPSQCLIRLRIQTTTSSDLGVLSSWQREESQSQARPTPEMHKRCLILPNALQKVSFLSVRFPGSTPQARHPRNGCRFWNLVFLTM